MTEYQHGGDIYSQEILLDYSANINPLGMPESVKEAVRQAVDHAAVYPDSCCRRLRAALGEFHRVEPERIICGNGAADLIFQLAYALRPKRALLPAPTFSEYGQALAAAGTEIHLCCLRETDNFRFDLELWKERAEEVRPELAFFCNPNNPTGLAVKKEVLEEMARFCLEQGIFLAVDECFCEFLDDSEGHSILGELGRFPNVFVLKAFTKIYAMAGLRLGYGICGDPGLMDRLESVRQPWTVSALAQEAGLAALKETDYVERTRELVRIQREVLKEGLARLGLAVWDSQANYLFFRGPEGLKERLAARKVLIRSCANYPGLDGRYYRICVGTEENNRRFLRELEAALEGKG